MNIFTDIEYIPAAKWNETLVQLNNGKRARYFEASIPLFDLSSVPERVTEVENQFNDAKKVYYSYTTKACELTKDSFGRFSLASRYPAEDEELTPGYKITIKIADTLDVEDDSPSFLAVAVAEKIVGYELNKYHSFTTKITPLAKGAKEALIQNQKLTDKLGVEIEIGDFVAHPTGTYGGGSSVEVSKVDSFGIGTANGWKADRLIVIKTDNPNKKLGWC